MPKYLMLIVENEADFEGVEAGSPKFNEVMQMHGDFTGDGREVRRQDPRRRGPAAGRHGDVPAQHPHVRRHRRRQPGARTSRRCSAATTSSRPPTTPRPASSPSSARPRPATSSSARSGTSRCERRGGGAAADAQRRYWGRVLAATLRLARDVDIAEEATADAFVLALQTWPERGVPDVGRGVAAHRGPAAGDRPGPPGHRVPRTPALDRRHRRARRRPGRRRGSTAPAVADDELRLVVLCCHPALTPEAQVALDDAARLRHRHGVGGGGVPRAGDDDGRAAHPRQAADRGVGNRDRPPRRSRDGGADAGGAAHDPPRLHDGPHGRFRAGLARRRRRRPRGAAGPPSPRPAPGRQRGRRVARVGAAHRGARHHPRRGRRRPGSPRRRRSPVLGSRPHRRRPGAGPRHPPRGPLAVHAAIAAEHARAPTLDGTDWSRIVALYDTLLAIEPSPTIAVGRCVALSYLLDAAAGLADLDEVLALASATSSATRTPTRPGRRCSTASGVAPRRRTRGLGRRRAPAPTAERAFFAAQAGSPRGSDR